MSSKTLSKNPAQGSLTSNPDLFSDEAWNLLLASQDVARRWRHGHLDVEHVLEVLFRDRAYKSFVEGLPIEHSDLLDRLEDFLADQPISRNESLIIGEDLEELLENAEHFRNRWGSRLIEISHILIAIGLDQRIGEHLLEEVGLDKTDAIKEIRAWTARQPDFPVLIKIPTLGQKQSFFFNH